METGRDGNMVDNESVTTGSNSYEKSKPIISFAYGVILDCLREFYMK